MKQYRFVLISCLMLLATIVSGCELIEVVGTGGKTYTITGQVIDASGNPLAGIGIGVTDPPNTFSSSTGAWEITGISGTVTVTPTQSGWVFHPSSQQVMVNSDLQLLFRGSPAEYYLAGVIADSEGLPLPNVVVDLGSFGTTTTNSDGQWSYSSASGTVTITPELPGLVFTPSKRIVTSEDDQLHFSAQTSRYRAEGLVMSGKGEPITGVILEFRQAGALVYITSTDATGRWYMDDLIGETIITARKAGYSFDPASQKVGKQRLNANFVGTP